MQKATVIIVLRFAVLLGIILNDVSITGHFVNESPNFTEEQYPWLLVVSLVVFVFVLISLTYTELYKHLHQK